MIRFSFGFFSARKQGGGVYGYAEYTKQQQFLKEKWGIGGTQPMQKLHCTTNPTINNLKKNERKIISTQEKI